MKLVIVRHGEPNYEIDSLTPKGEIEAKLLAEKLSNLDVKAFYSSPLGRAVKTGSYTLEKINRTATVLPWLREFEGKCKKPGKEEVEYCWDWLPTEFVKHPLFYDKDKWVEDKVFKNTNVPEQNKIVCDGLDKLLEENGYRRNGLLYDAVSPNNDTIVLFCHLGVMAIMAGHLLGLSPFVLLHAFAPAPSSVTTIATEERLNGKASFRVLSYGDQSHLYKGLEEPSFACRFCECFSNKDQRHD